MRKTMFVLVVITVVMSGVSYGVIRVLSRQAQVTKPLTGVYQSRKGPGSQQNQAGALPLRRSVMAFPRSLPKYHDLKDLVAHSTEIFAGVAVAKTPRLTGAQDSMIFTDWEIRVLEPIEGDQHRNRRTVVEFPGGLSVAGDGTANEVRAPDFWKQPEIGKSYVFFVTRRKNAPSQLVGGPQGLFQISPWPDSFSLSAPPNIAEGRSIVPQALDSDELMKNNNGKKVSDFLSQVKLMVGPRVRRLRNNNTTGRR